MKNNKQIGIFFLLVLLVFSLNYVHSQENPSEVSQNLTNIERANYSLENIKEVSEEMNGQGFNIQRINDSLNQAREIYQTQKDLEEPDFTLVYKSEKDVFEIKQNAYLVKDELYIAKKSIDDLRKRKLNLSSIENIVNNIDSEIADERYEKALELIDVLNKKISEIEASSTTLNVFYKVTKRTFVDFFKENILKISITIFVLSGSILLFKKKILRKFYKRKITGLKLEKETLEKLVKKTQKDYFEDNKISKGLYNIKLKKFSELIRDINRKIPLIKVKLAALNKK